MARRVARRREDHRPGDIALAAPHFRLDEIGEAAQENANRRHHGAQVGDGEQGLPLRPGEQRHADDRADQAAMKGHSALPGLKNFHRVREIKARVVNQHVTEPTADDDAERDVNQEIVDRQRRRASLARPPKRLAPAQNAQIKPAENEAADIGQRIPAQRQRPKIDRDRIDHREWNGEEGHEGVQGVRPNDHAGHAGVLNHNPRQCHAFAASGGPI